MAVSFFVAMAVSSAVIQNSFWLAIAAVVTGMLFMVLARSRAKIRIDEREKLMREKAAQFAYAIFTPVIGLGSVAITFLGRKADTPYLSSLGIILSYLTLFLISIYSLAYYTLSKRYGGSGDEK